MVGSLRSAACRTHTVAEVKVVRVGEVVFFLRFRKVSDLKDEEFRMALHLF
jgi:hypothetical protein